MGGFQFVISSVLKGREADQVNKHFDNTIAHIKVRQEAGNDPTFKNLLA